MEVKSNQFKSSPVEKSEVKLGQTESSQVLEIQSSQVLEIQSSQVNTSSLVKTSEELMIQVNYVKGGKMYFLI